MQNQNVYNKILEELNELDKENVDVEGITMKPSQCYRYSFNPVHLLFNRNCPDSLREKVSSIFDKYGLGKQVKSEEIHIDFTSADIPASVKELKPKIYKQGDHWFALSEDDIGTGIYGEGNTPEKAMQNFDANYAKTKENSV